MDLVYLDPGSLKANYVVEVKWSDRCFSNPSELKSLRSFIGKNKSCTVYVTTKTIAGDKTIDGMKYEFLPSAVYCYYIGWNMINRRKDDLEKFLVAESTKNRQEE